jgi:hypothetical protein
VLFPLVLETLLEAFRPGGWVLYVLEHVPYLTPFSPPLVIVNNLHIDWPFCRPFEANTVLFIYSDAVLPLPVASESLQAVSRRDSKLSEERNRIQ